MAVKTGIPTLHRAARTMCALVRRMIPYILRSYPDNTALWAAVAATESACAALELATGPLLEIGD